MDDENADARLPGNGLETQRPNILDRKALPSILALCLCWLSMQATRARAFSLLGPYEAWMQTSNCFRLPVTPLNYEPGDIGGPMCISNGYRWNVPVVTYGFDQSFLNFFGSNGVAAVEGAIQILNEIPPASSVELTNYPDQTEWINPPAQAQSLYDLQSVTLSLLLEQLGLASPSRFVFVVQYWINEPGGPLFYVIRRNYDPETLIPSEYVNGILFEYEIWSGISLGIDEAEAVSIPEFVGAPQETAVADNRLMVGSFCDGLTADDVGGLAYLLSTNNVCYETLTCRCFWSRHKCKLVRQWSMAAWHRQNHVCGACVGLGARGILAHD